MAIALSAAAAGAAPMTNDLIDCRVDVQNATGLLRVELSQDTWDLGPVPRGGMKDTWFGETTHGKFWVRNTGDSNTAVFVTALSGTNSTPLEPDFRLPPDPLKFAMAVATNVTGVLPDWKLLNQPYTGTVVGRYARDLMPGDYMLFDLRFYAGPDLPTGIERSFRVGVYATPGEFDTPNP
jgi:hypothetical protein